MKRTLMTALFAVCMAFASLATARAMRDIEDGKLMIEPKADVHFAVEGNVMGKAQLFGYVSDLKDREKFDAIVLKEGGDDAQRAAIRSIAKTLQLKAFEETGDGIKPLGE